jgi:hypothetical protein
MADLADKLLSAIDAIVTPTAEQSPKAFLKRMAKKRRWSFPMEAAESIRHEQQCIEHGQREQKRFDANGYRARIQADQVAVEAAVANGAPVPEARAVEHTSATYHQTCDAISIALQKHRTRLAALAKPVAESLAGELESEAAALEKTERETCGEHSLDFHPSPLLKRLTDEAATLRKRNLEVLNLL